MNVLALRPKVAAVAETIHAAFIQDHPQYAGGTKPPRRLKHEFRTPYQGAIAEIVREDVAGKLEFQLQLVPQDHLVGRGALSSGYQAIAMTPWCIAVFKVGLKDFLPSLDENFLESLEESNFRTTKITVPKHVKFETEALAMQALWKLHAHCKVALDSGVTLSKRKRELKTPVPIVTSDPSCRNAFRIILPYGEIKVSLKRDFGEYPITLKGIKDFDQRGAMYASVRTLLSFDFFIDLGMFRYFDDGGAERSFPSSFREWTKDHLPCNPNLIAWNQMLYELWLNVDLATAENEIGREGLTRTQEKVLDAYLAGELMLRGNLLPEKFEEAKEIHEALVTQAGVNILTPWVVNKLHQGKIYREVLGASNLFDPGKDPHFEGHTLSTSNIKSAIQAFSSDMEGIPGWSFVPAA